MISILKHLPGKHDQKLHAPKKVAPSASRIAQIKEDYDICCMSSDRLTERNRQLRDYYRIHSGTAGAQAVRDYTGSDYGAINDKLRGVKSYPGENFTIDRVAAEGNIPVIDDFIANAKRTPDNMVVFRRASTQFTGGQLSKLRPGDEFIDKGFVSTTMNVKRMSTVKYDEWDIDDPEKLVPFAIALPKGSKAAYVTSISKVPNEEEMLLPRNSKFRYIGREDGYFWLDYLGD